jgi:hypothetical protein
MDSDENSRALVELDDGSRWRIFPGNMDVWVAGGAPTFGPALSAS